MQRESNNLDEKTLIKKLEKEVSELNGRIKIHTDMLRVEREKSKANLLKMSEVQTTLNKRIAEVSKLKGKLSELQRESNNLDEEILIKKLKKEVSELKDKLSELQRESNNLDEEILIKKLEKEVSVLKKDLASLKINYEDAEKEKNILSKKLDQTTDDMKSLRASNKALQISLEEANLLIKSLRSGAGAEYKTWKDVEGSLSVQQQRFCGILLNFQKSFSASLSSANQIKVNNTIFERDQNIDALIPGGKFNNWVGRVVEIFQTPNLDAGYSIELQCAARFSTGQIDIDGNSKWVATAKRDSRIFNQLSKLSKNQFVVFSGTMVKYQDISNQELMASYVTKYEGDGEWTEWEQYFESMTGKKDGEIKLLDTENTDFMFFADIEYLSQY